MYNISPQRVKLNRNSSVELLRIIAMAMVLFSHWNWSFLGAHKMLDTPEKIGLIRIIVESILVICVNLFLLITGYYGIRFKVRTFFNIGILVTSVLLLQYLYANWNNLFTFRILEPFFFLSSSDYFVVDYIFLMFLSPILNDFIASKGKKILPFVIFLFVIEVWFGCIRKNDYFFINRGYSITHFIVIYLISRCLCLYKERLRSISQYVWLLLFSTCVFLNVVMCYAKVSFTWDYCSPIVIIESISFFMLFVTRNFYNKVINWIASGTFSVYILHRYNPIHDYLKSIDINLYTSETYAMYVVKSLPVLVIFFFVAIFYDKFISIFRKPILYYCDAFQKKFLAFL